MGSDNHFLLIDNTPKPARPVVSRRVLVMEDNPDSRLSLLILLGMRGYDVEEAEDGLRGVRKALAWQPEVAVVDIGLPVFDGYEVARQLKAALGGDIRLIALTAYGRTEDKQRAFAAGFDVHLTKPADPDELCQHLRPA